MIGVFTGFLVLVGFLQWWLIRRQDKHFRTSERAWILADLGWYPGHGHVQTDISKSGGVNGEYTNVNAKLTCRNEGRSPAWIDEIRGYVEIITSASAIGSPDNKKLRPLGTMEPLGAGKEQSRVLQMQCSWKVKENELLSVYVIVEYHDIFGKKRETFLGYSILSDGGIYRQLAIPERNRNT
jgi:hypothetical protein